MSKIFFDNNSTTALDPQVLKAVIDEMSEGPSNPSSVHFYGQRARRKLIQARDSIAKFFRVASDEIYFTSGGTEALNMVIRGLAESYSLGHIITSDLEHPAVYNTIQELEKKGYSVTYLSGGEKGSVSSQDVSEAIRDDTIMISLMAVNNETGVKTDIDTIAALAEGKKIAFVVDGVAWLGKESFEISRGISAICFSGHKIHAPKGVGIAYISDNINLKPILTGGGQESGLRSGTENLPAIVGMSEAIKILGRNQKVITKDLLALRVYLEEALLTRFSNASINGTGERISNTVSVNFSNTDGESLLMALDQNGISVSLGSACSSGGCRPSRVLLNMGRSYKEASSSIRFSLSRFNTIEEVEMVLDVLSKIEML